jgi:hypothetical protein
MARIRLGNMRVAAGMLAAEQLEYALAGQNERGWRLGEVLVALGSLGEVQLAQVFSTQWSIPWVNLHHVECSRELRNLIPGELAKKIRRCLGLQRQAPITRRGPR